MSYDVNSEVSNLSPVYPLFSECNLSDEKSNVPFQIDIHFYIFGIRIYERIVTVKFLLPYINVLDMW